MDRQMALLGDPFWLIFSVNAHLKAIACSGHGKMKMIRIIIEHLGLLRVVVVICDMELLRLVT